MAGQSNLISLRWFYFAIFLVLAALALLVAAQHLYFGLQYTFTPNNVPKLAAAIVVAVSGLLQAIRNGVNPQGEQDVLGLGRVADVLFGRQDQCLAIRAHSL